MGGGAGCSFETPIKGESGVTLPTQEGPPTSRATKSWLVPTCRRMRAHGASDTDAPPPLRSPIADKLPQPIAFPIRPPEKGLSTFSGL